MDLFEEFFLERKKKKLNAHKRSERKKEEKIVEKGHLWQAMNAIENEYVYRNRRERKNEK